MISKALNQMEKVIFINFDIWAALIYFFFFFFSSENRLAEAAVREPFRNVCDFVTPIWNGA